MLHFCRIFSVENSFLSALGPELDFLAWESYAVELADCVGAKKILYKKIYIGPLGAASRKKSIGASIIAYFKIFIYDVPFVYVKMYTNKKYFHSDLTLFARTMQSHWLLFKH